VIKLPKADVRERLRRNLERELMGPADGEEEEIEQLPATTYIVGVLYPSSTPFDPEQDTTVDNPLNRISMVERLRPSSMGMSFVVDGSVEELNVLVRWGIYNQEVEKGPFKREEREKNVPIQTSLHGQNRCKVDEDHDFHLVWRIYPYTDHSNKIISIFLVNEETASNDKAVLNTRCIFTPKLKVELPHKAILAKEGCMEAIDEEDLKSLRLLYHRRHEFGTGHGCSVVWDVVEGNRCGRIETTFLPIYLQQPITFREDEYVLSMESVS